MIINQTMQWETRIIKKVEVKKFLKQKHKFCSIYKTFVFIWKSLYIAKNKPYNWVSFEH